MICNFFNRSDIDGNKVEDVDCSCERICWDSGSRRDGFMGPAVDGADSGAGGLRSFLKAAFSSFNLPFC